MTLILDVNLLDISKLHSRIKSKFAGPRHSKVRGRTDRQTDREREREKRDRKHNHVTFASRKTLRDEQFKRNRQTVVQLLRILRLIDLIIDYHVRTDASLLMTGFLARSFNSVRPSISLSR